MSRRISTFKDEYGNPMSIPMKIMSTWDAADEAWFVVANVKFKTDVFLVWKILCLIFESWGKESPDVPRKSVPRRMTVDEFADVIDSALEGIALIILIV